MSLFRMLRLVAVKGLGGGIPKERPGSWMGKKKNLNENHITRVARTGSQRSNAGKRKLKEFINREEEKYGPEKKKKKGALRRAAKGQKE